MKSPALALFVIAAAAAVSACSKSKAPEPPQTTVATVPAKGELIAVTAKEAEWVAAEKAKYPMQVCAVSDARLGSMGEPPAYIYREPGKADRLVLFCCNDCPPDFRKDPAAYLKKIDAAAAASAAKKTSL